MSCVFDTKGLSVKKANLEIDLKTKLQQVIDHELYQKFEGRCETCKYAFWKNNEVEDCEHEHYDGGDPICVDGWWGDDHRCKNWVKNG